MDTLPGRPVRWPARGVSDAEDGTDAFPGALQSGQNLIPSPRTAGQLFPRPAATSLYNFNALTSPAQINAQFMLGSICYGMIAETGGAFNGKDVPFAFNILTGTNIPVTIPGGAASLPATPAAIGAWTPPTVTAVGGRIIFTHPGFTGGINPFFGWLDISGFSSATVTGNTHTTTTVDTLSTNVLTLGWQPGMLITDSAGDIPANTVITDIAAGGLSVTISNAATGSNSGTTFTVTGGTPAAPLWSSGNTVINKLKAVPVAVFNFTGRAYYAVPGNGMQASDSLIPCQITNATQQLNPANGLDVTAFGGVGLLQTQGGVLQSLIAFQGDQQMQQITGDFAFNAGTAFGIAMNALGEGVGCLAPNTIASTPLGLMFVAPDGLRVIDINARVSEPIGANGDGVCYPFLSALVPSRMAGAFNQNVYRVTVQNGAVVGQPYQEWWYDFRLKTWSGPHTSTAALIEASQSATQQGFVMVLVGVNAELFLSGVTPTINDTYVENGKQLTFAYQTVLLPDTQDMTQNKVVLSTLMAAISRNETWTVQALDEQGNTLDQVILSGPSAADPLWGTAVWGAFVWGGAGTFQFQHQLLWHLPLIFKQMSIMVTGNCALGSVIGNLYLQIEDLGYVVPAPSVPSFQSAPGAFAIKIGEGAIGVNATGGTPPPE